jgi:protein-S-isoprenylcysteine O-methyltransferase Ste14
MSNQQILILIAISAFTISGIVINLWKRNKNSSETNQRDGNTLLLFRLVVPATIITSVVAYLLGIAKTEHSLFVNVIGYVMVIVGFTIRWVAVISLGKLFTVSVTILNDHKLRTNGIYSIVRHPSYTGLIIYYTGLGIMFNNFISLALLVLLPLAVIVHRINLEEKVLYDQFKQQYSNYQAKTWKLIPFLY